MSYNSLEEIVRECQEKDLPFDEVILLDDMNERNVSREELSLIHISEPTRPY